MSAATPEITKPMTRRSTGRLFESVSFETLTVSNETPTVSRLSFGKTDFETGVSHRS